MTGTVIESDAEIQASWSVWTGSRTGSRGPDSGKPSSRSAEKFTTPSHSSGEAPETKIQKSKIAQRKSSSVTADKAPGVSSPPLARNSASQTPD